MNISFELALITWNVVPSPSPQAPVPQDVADVVVDDFVVTESVSAVEDAIAESVADKEVLEKYSFVRSAIHLPIHPSITFYLFRRKTKISLNFFSFSFSRF